MAKGNSDVLVTLGADTDALQGSLAGLGNDVLNWLGGINPAVAGVVGTVAGIGVTAFSVAEDFKEAYNQIIVGTGATGDALAGLESSFKTLYKQVPQDAAVVGKSLADVNTALGLQGEELEKATKGFLDLSDSIGEDVGPLIQNVTQAMNAWGVAASDATLVQDKLLVVSQNTGISTTELASQLTKGEAVFKQFGLSLDESAALLGQFHKNGLDAGTVTGSLQKALREMAENGVKPSKESFLGLIDNIKNAGNESGSTQKAIDLFGKSGVAMGQAIREGKLDIDGLVESLANAEGQVARTDDATNTIGESFTLLTHNVQTLLEPLGIVLVDGLTAVVEGLLALFDPLTYTSDGFKAILDWLSPLTEAFTNSYLPALRSVGELMLGLGVTIIQGALIPALTFLWQNVLVPVGGFLRDVLAGAINTVYGALNGFLEVLKSVPGISSLFEAGQKALNTVLGDGKTKADEAKASTSALKDSHGELAKTLDGSTHPAVKNVTGAIADKKSATELARKATDELKDAEKILAEGYKSLTLPAVKSVWEAQGDVEEARKNLTESTKRLFDAEQTLKGKLNDTRTSSKDLKTALDDLDRAKKSVKSSSDALKTAQSDLAAAQKKSKEDAENQRKAFEELGKELDSIHVEVVPQFNAGLEDIGANFATLVGTLGTAKTTAEDAQRALVALGVTPKEELLRLAESAEQNFTRIKEAGVASPREIDLANKAMLEKKIEYYTQSGQQVPPLLQAELDGLKAKYDDHKGKVVGVFDTMKSSVQQSITQLSTDLVKSLWSGDGSFGEKAMSTLKTLGESVTTAFVTPATNAISNFISGAISDLLGGKGLGGVMDRMKDIGGAFSGVFGNGNAPGVPGGTPSVPSGGPAGGAAGAVGSGLAGTLTAVFSGISAVTDILGLFGVGRQGEKDRLNLIADATTFVAQAFGDRGLENTMKDQANNIDNFVNGSFGGWYHEALMSQMWTAEQGFELTTSHLGTVAGNTYKSVKSLEELNAMLPSKLDQLINSVPIVNNYLTAMFDGKEIASRLSERQDLQFRLSVA